MYIGNHFRKCAECPSPAYKKRISFSPARLRCLSRNHFASRFPSFRFFSGNFDVRSSMPARSSIRSLNTCESFSPPARSPRRHSHATGNSFTSRESNPIRFYRRLDPNVTARDSHSLPLFRDNLGSLRISRRKREAGFLQTGRYFFFFF